MKSARWLGLALASVMLCACAGAAKRNAELYNSARAADVKEAQAAALSESNASAARATAIAALAAKCPAADSGCVVALGDKLALSDAIAGLTKAAQRSAAKTPIPYERDGAAKARDWIGAISPFGMAAVNGWVAKAQSDNSTLVQLGEQSMVQGIVAGATGAARDVAQTAVEHASPNITVGGDYVSGTQHIGDTLTGDGNATRGGQIGDTQTGDGNAARGGQIVEGVLVDNSEGTQIETGEGDQTIEQGQGDQQSPPTNIDNSNDGDECTGEHCQGDEIPEDPDPET